MKRMCVCVCAVSRKILNVAIYLSQTQSNERMYNTTESGKIEIDDFVLSLSSLPSYSSSPSPIGCLHSFLWRISTEIAFKFHKKTTTTKHIFNDYSFDVLRKAMLSVRAVFECQYICMLNKGRLAISMVLVAYTHRDIYGKIDKYFKVRMKGWVKTMCSSAKRHWFAFLWLAFCVSTHHRTTRSRSSRFLSQEQCNTM